MSVSSGAGSHSLGFSFCLKPSIWIYWMPAMYKAKSKAPSRERNDRKSRLSLEPQHECLTEDRKWEKEAVYVPKSQILEFTLKPA